MTNDIKKETVEQRLDRFAGDTFLKRANDMGYPTAEAAISAGRSCPRPYPLDGFWRTASRYPVKAVINADAHDPAVLTRYLHLGYQMAETYGIEVVYPFGK